MTDGPTHPRTTLLATTLWVLGELLVALVLARTMLGARYAGLALLMAGVGLLALDVARRLLWLVIGPSRLVTRLGLCLAAVLLSLAAAEVVLAVVRPTLRTGGGPTVVDPDMPVEWRRRRAPVDGARRAYYWHGHLHVEDDRRMRRSTPFPEKSPGVPRVLVVGDSLTYGMGVGAEQAYASVLQEELQDQDVEVLNLGISGHQSEDILEELRHFVPSLRPDRVLYGMFLNDFLPSERGQPREARTPPTPTVLDLLRRRSRVVRFTATAWQKYRIRTGRENDAMLNIQVDFDNRQRRFLRDVQAMNAVLREHEVAPLLAYVLNHHPRAGSEANRLTAIAEELLREAGAEVIPAGPFLERHDGEDFEASPWEAHPSAECHRLFALEILPALAESLRREPLPR